MLYCSTNFSNKEPTGGRGVPPSGRVAALVSAAAVHPLVAGLPGSGDTPSFRETLEEGGRKRIRLSKKTNVRKRFGVGPWEQPIPKRWKADTLRGVAFHGQSWVLSCY